MHMPIRFPYVVRIKIAVIFYFLFFGLPNYFSEMIVGQNCVMRPLHTGTPIQPRVPGDFTAKGGSISTQIFTLTQMHIVFASMSRGANTVDLSPFEEFGISAHLKRYH